MERDNTPPITMSLEDPKLGHQARDDDLRDGEVGGEGKRCKQSSTSIAVSLPEDILIKILYRFPVKTLVGLRCVCRSWKTLISDPIFIDIHLKASIQDEGYSNHRLIMSSDCIPFDVKSCSLASVLDEEYPDIHDHFYPLKHPQRSVLIVGSINGLVCIAIDKGSVFVWNPSTRKSKRLPNCGFKKRTGGSIVYGFGYDEVNSEYKVMALFSQDSNPYPYSPFKTEVKIYGLKGDSWRKIGDFPKHFPLRNASAMFVSGSLHWAGGNPLDHGYSWSTMDPIVSFDLLKETYSEFSQPLYGVGTKDSTLGVLCDCLCLLCNMGYEEVGYVGYEEADVWVMKEYGKLESWSKLFTIPYYPNELNLHRPRLFSVPLCISFRKDEVLLVLGSLLVLYNINNHEVCETDINNCGREYIHTCLKACTYIESLVSPYPERCNRER